MHLIDVSESPQTRLHDLIEQTQSNDSRTRRQCARLLERALKLAQQRGYNKAPKFLASYRSAIEESAQIPLKQLTRALFEYVSPDEFMQLTRTQHDD